MQQPQLNWFQNLKEKNVKTNIHSGKILDLLGPWLHNISADYTVSKEPSFLRSLTKRSDPWRPQQIFAQVIWIENLVFGENISFRRNGKLSRKISLCFLGKHFNHCGFFSQVTGHINEEVDPKNMLALIKKNKKQKHPGCSPLRCMPIVVHTWNFSHRLLCWNTWCPAGGAVGEVVEPSTGKASLGEGSHWG